MKYAIATIGAVFIFVAVVVVSMFANGLLPTSFQQRVFIGLGLFGFGGTPALLVGIAVGSLAAVSSFRSTLVQYTVIAERN
jgi:hypothetical protein